jgi:hypothetical protein
MPGRNSIGTDSSRVFNVRVPSARSALVVVAIAVLAAACGSSPPDHVSAIIATLNKATYTDCGQQAHQVAQYLVTGNPQSLDPQYLSVRTDVLRQPQGVQDAYIRQYVNQLVAQCDQTELAAIHAQQAAQQAAADRVAYEASCTQLGGSLALTDGGGLVLSVHDPHIAWTADAYKAGQCIVTYYVTGIDQSLAYVLPLASNGAFDPTEYVYNRDVRCNGYPELFHADTGVCLVVGFSG